MHFKKLEIIGFKSFAEKTQLEFHPGVTAIVGPNGCGKSNVSDSIKWVLGEQSARSLRGHRMEDIIFNGAAMREPVNFAEVSITFTNEDRAVPLDYDEVIISRRLYRSGESEYLINKSQVRLKDIQSLLAGTGLGVGNYSVIEQGRINQILTAKPEDRRTLFEEAAGITRFKQQKKEALRNLEATEQNLQRVTDIIVEQKRQIGSLERQAKKAEAYKRDFEKLKTHDLIVAREEREQFIQVLDARRAMSEELKAGLEELAGLCESAEEELSEARAALQAIDQEYQETKSQHLILENQIKNNDEKIAIFSTYIEEIRTKLAEIDAAAAEAAQRIAGLETEEAGLAETLVAIEAEREAGQRLVEESEALFAGIEGELALAKEESAVLKTTLADAVEEEHRAESALGLLASEHAAKEADRAETAAEIQSLDVQQQILNDECRTAEEQANALAQEIRERILERERLEAQLGQDRDEKASLDAQLAAMHQDAASKRSKLEMMENFAKSHEGFSQGARHILGLTQSEPAWESRVLGALADLVEVDRGYEVAVESALETLSQAIVCERDEDVIELSHRLRDAKQGRAVLLRLDAAPADGSGAASVSLENGLRRLSDVTRAEERVSRLYSHLVKDIYVAVDPIQAAAMSRRYPHAVFVTREGEAYRAMTVLAGSADSPEESLIFGREGRIKEIKNQQVELQLETERLTARRDQVAAHIAAIEENLKQQGELVPRLQVKLADVQSRKEHRGNEREKIQERLGRLRATLSELESRLTALAGETSELRVSLEAAAARKSESEARSLSLQEIIDSAAQRREDGLVEITRRKSQFETVLERFEQSQRALDRLREALRVERASTETRRRDQEGLIGREAETREQLDSLQTQSIRLTEEREQLLERHNAIAIEKEDRAARLVETESRHAELFQRQQSDREKTHVLEMEIERSMHEAQRLKDRILAAYQIDLDNEPVLTMIAELPALPERAEGVENGEDSIAQILSDELSGTGETPVPQPQAAAPEPIVFDPNAGRLDPAEAEELRQKLAKMGPVNLVAMEEYEDLQKRHEFLSREKEDLLRAKDDIHKALLKINRTTREMFIDTFTKIQAYFVEYFKLLFNGGNAEIVLLDEGDVLESGIEIVARPPGKKLNSITLMSGGEQALTAIALMFAVFKVKPSPFCVLDEIDAPLDDSNVQRFANALQEFIKESQFIIITHNKRTMSVADVLYGVTMQRSGVSQVVSVKFGGDGPVLGQAMEKQEAGASRLSEAPSRQQVISENLA